MSKSRLLGLGLAESEATTIQLIDLVGAVTTCITPELKERIAAIGAGQDWQALYRPYIQFAEMLTFAPVVPFEQSPLSLESIGTIITKASGVGLGAYAGFVVAGSSPLIFVTVPAGMIIFGAAAGVANALEKGLRDRLLRVIKGKR